MHDFEFGQKFTYDFVSHHLNELRQHQVSFQQNNPNGIFTVNEDKAALGLYVVRNLIRRGNTQITSIRENLINDIRFLLSIPEIRSRAHLSLDENGQENELLRLASHIGNSQVSSLLLQLPEVHNLAEQSNFYRQTQCRGLDLAQIARDRESSMVALSVSEKKLVTNIQKHYQPKIEDIGGGISVAFQYLLKDIEQRYEAFPAKLDIDGKETVLPFSQRDFVKMLKDKIIKTDYFSLAMQAYAKNIYHTSYRYLSKPNVFMHQNAAYVYQFEQRGRIYRYSTFQEYINIVVPFFLAASDEVTPAIDGYPIYP